jgi:hypothetical protein
VEEEEEVLWPLERKAEKKNSSQYDSAPLPIHVALNNHHAL